MDENLSKLICCLWGGLTSFVAVVVTLWYNDRFPKK